MNLFQNFLRIQHAFGRFFMFEVRKHIALLPNMFADSFNHSAALVGRIVRLALALVSEVRGHNVVGGQLFGLGDAQRTLAAS